MKILHSSDWHLGHRLHEQSQYEEQLLFLNWLRDLIQQKNIDVLLVAGDVFDTGVPSSQSQKLYYDFLIGLKQTPCKHVVITGGNHDAPGTLNAPKALLQSLSVHVVGKASENVQDEVFNLSANGEPVIVAAIPYLRDQDIRRAIAGESFDQLGDRYKAALIKHYAEVADYCNEIKLDEACVLAMGHLFALGGTTSDSEQTIYVGNLGDIGANDFPKVFDYIALGHLHRAQKVGQLNHIRYSGSPCILSFSELGQTKQLVLIETDKGNLKEISEVPIPEFRVLNRISGSVDDCITQIMALNNAKHPLTPWVEVILNNTSKTSIGYAEIYKKTEGLNVQVLKVSFKNERSSLGLEKLIENSKHIKDLSPVEVFRLKCKEQNFDLEENPQIFDAFHEILQSVREVEE